MKFVIPFLLAFSSIFAMGQIGVNPLGDQHGTLRGHGAPAAYLCNTITVGQIYADADSGATYTCSSALTWVAGVSSGSGQLAVTPVSAFWQFGDSFAQAYGATNPSTTSAMALLAANTPAPNYNYGVGGTTQPQITSRIFSLFAANPLSSSLTLQIGGHNDGLHDSCGGTSTSGCAQNFKLALDAAIAWSSIPIPNRQMASTCSGTGFSTDTTATGLIYTSLILASPGTPQKATTSGAVLTCSVPSTPSTSVGITYLVTNGQTGTFTVSVDGVLQTDATTGTTTWSSGGAQGVAVFGTTSTFFRQFFPVTANTTHTVVVTSTSASQMDVTSVDTIPAAGTIGLNTFYFVGPNAFYQYASTYDSMAQGVVAAEKTAGIPVYFVSQINGTPGVNATTDLSTTATTTAPGSTFSGHPNDLGQLHLLQTIENAEIANGFRFSKTRENASAIPFLEGPPTIQTYNTGLTTPTLGSSFVNFNTSTIFPAGFDMYRAGTNRLGWGFTQDPSTGLPWSGGYIDMTYNSISTGYFCVSSLASGGTNYNSAIPNSSYVCKFGVSHATGRSFQLGSSTATYHLVQTGAAIASATTLPALTSAIQHVTGTTAIATIPPPTDMSSTVGGTVSFIFDNGLSTTTAGNIAAVYTFSAGQKASGTYDGTKWYF